MNPVLCLLAVTVAAAAVAAEPDHAAGYQLLEDDSFATLAARVHEARNLAIGPTTSDVIAQLVKDCGSEVFACAFDEQCGACVKDFNPDAFNFDPNVLADLDFDAAMAQLQAAFPKTCTDLVVNRDSETGDLVQCSLHSALNKAVETVKGLLPDINIPDIIDVPDIPDINLPDIPDPLNVIPDIPDIQIPDIPDIPLPDINFP